MPPFRPIGGWISDKWGGSIVTQIISAIMVVASVAVGYVMMPAYGSAGRKEYFRPSSVCSCCCLPPAVSATAAPSTIGVIFDRQQAGRCWLDVCCCGLWRLHRSVVIGDQIKRGTPQLAMYGFTPSLRRLPDFELVVLPAPRRVRQNPDLVHTHSPLLRAVS